MVSKCGSIANGALVLALLVLPSRQAGGQEYADLRAAWQKKNYVEAAKGFATYRTTNRTSADADYMLATSLCRTGEKAKGVELLRWMLSQWTQGAVYTLTPQWVDAIGKELSVCTSRNKYSIGPGTGPWIVPSSDSSEPGGTSVIILPPDAYVLPLPAPPR